MEAQAISSCRSCGLSSEKLILLLSLGNLYVSNFIDNSELSEAYPRVPLDLLLCDESQGGCGLVQLKYNTPSDWMYQKYWYRSGTNTTMRNALADISTCVEQIAQPTAGDIVLDIGANDGTLLRSYSIPGLKRVGFEPATNLLEEASQATDRIFPAHFNSEDFLRAFPNKRAKAITSIAMFYDLENPHRFTEDIARCLDPEGIWILQMSYLPLMLSRNAFDNLCHEHLEYYSLRSLERILDSHGLKIADVQLNDVNGGSFRVIACHQESRLGQGPPGQRRVEELKASEEKMGFSDRGIYEKFFQRVLQIKEKLYRFISNQVTEGRRVYVYGASTKGNTLLQFFSLDHRLIRKAAERSSHKWGKKTIGTMIPVVSEEEARQARPDFFLVLPWPFKEEFMERERAYLQQGGRFILPLPEPEVVALTGRRKL